MQKTNALFKWTKPHLFMLFVILFLTIIIPVTYSYVPQFIKYVFDFVLDEKEGASNTLPGFLLRLFAGIGNKFRRVITVGVFLILFQLIRGCLMFASGVLKGEFAEKIAYDMRDKLSRHLQDLPVSYYNTIDSGDLIQRCTSDIDTIKTFVSTDLTEILSILATFVSGAVQMAMIDVNIMLITLCVIPVNVIGGIIYFLYVNRKYTEIEKYEADMTSFVEENVNGVRVVKAFAKEKDEIAEFTKKSRKYCDEGRIFNTKVAVFWGFSDCVTYLQFAVTIGYCIYLAKTGSGLGMGDMIACASYISLLVYPVRGLGRIIGNFGKSIVAAGRINEILLTDVEYKINGELMPEIKGNIVFDDVYFKFPDSSKYLLNGVSFKIKAGETIAIVGQTGSGKSTIVNLLVRMLEYGGGHIYLDGVELKEIEKRHLRKHVGIILQNPFLYAKTVYENIKIADPYLSRESVYHAAKIASVDKDIQSFSEGYETMVGEKGVTLSGGQKQRIAIARMLVLHKPVMIFDDSLSALDTKTDLEIRTALKKENKELTSVIITHRITTAKEADRIIVLENGKVTATGTHRELLEIPGLYKSLWDIQGSLESDFLKMVDKEVAGSDANRK